MFNNKLNTIFIFLYFLGITSSQEVIDIENLLIQFNNEKKIHNYEKASALAEKIISILEVDSLLDKETFEKVHESPPVMILPLFVLAIGAMFSGVLFVEYFVGHDMEKFWGSSILMISNIIDDAHHVSKWVAILPTFAAIIGIIVAWVMYMFKPSWPNKLIKSISPLYHFVLNKWYFDELYKLVFIRPAFYIGRGLWKSGDGSVIDGVGPDGIAAATLDLAKRAGRIQSGFVYHYAFAMLIGVVVFATWFLFGFFQ